MSLLSVSNPSLIVRRLCFSIVGAVLLLAGIAKLIDANDLIRAVIALGLRNNADVTVTGVVGLELALGAACLLGIWSRVLTSTLLLTLTTFTAALIVLRIRTGQGTCGCFGAALAGIGGESFGFALARNAILIALVVMPGLLGTLGRLATRRRCVTISPNVVCTTGMALLMAALSGSAAVAQLSITYSPWHHSYEKPLQTSFTRIHLDAFIEQVQLEETQADLARHFFAEHEKRFLEFREQHEPTCEFPKMVEDCHALLELIGEARIEALIPLAEREEKLEPIAEAQIALEARLLEELRLLLSEPQKEHWPVFIKWLNRERYGGHGGYPGDHIHLFTILEPMQLTDADLFIPATDFEAFLRQYARELDTLIVRRHEQAIGHARETIRFELRHQRANQPLCLYDEFGEHIDTTTRDPGYLEEVKKRNESSLKLGRDLHRLQMQYRNSLTGKLSPQRLKEFHDRFHELVIELRPPRAEAWINSLLVIEDLDENRQLALEQMLSELLRWWREMTIEEYEIAERRAELRFETGDNIPGVDDPKMVELGELQDRQHALMEERTLRDDGAMHRAWNLFTIEERGLLPSPPFWRDV